MVKNKVPDQLHDVRCHVYVLNLVISDTTNKCVENLTLFSLLNAIAVLVRESYLRMNKLETSSKIKFISVIREIRWWAKDVLIKYLVHLIILKNLYLWILFRFYMKFLLRIHLFRM